MNEQSVTSRVVGFVGSFVFTMAAFVLVVYREFFHLDVTTVILTILMLGVIQAVLQCICFLHLWKEKGLPWNLVMFFSTIGMAFVIIAFSIWIMNHLNYNMMPAM